MPDEMRALHESAAPFILPGERPQLLRARPSGPRREALGSADIAWGCLMSTSVRLLLAAILALFIAAPAGAVQPQGSAAWTTDGWVSLSGNLLSGPGPQYDVTGTIEEGVRVRVDRCSKRWCQIHTASARGWLSLDNLSFGQVPDGLFAGAKFPTQRGGGVVCFYSGEGFSGVSFCAKSGRVIPDLALVGGNQRRGQCRGLPRPRLPLLLRGRGREQGPAGWPAEQRHFVDPGVLKAQSLTVLVIGRSECVHLRSG